MRLPSVAVLVLSGLVVGPSVAQQPSEIDNDWYVATTGSDSNPGTLDAPFRTLAHGVSMVRPGDTVWVREGIYRESFEGTIRGGTSWPKRVKLAAWPDEAVTIQPEPGADFVFRFSSVDDSFIVIDGFNINAANVDHDAVKITYSGHGAAHHIRIKNSEIVNSPGSGVLITRNRKFIPRHNEFINLEIHDNGVTDFDHGTYIASSNNLVRNSSIYRNAGWGIHVYNGDYPELTADNNVIRNNEIFDNARVGDRGPGIILSSGRNNAAYNNLLWGNMGGIQIDYGALRAKAFNNTMYANAYGVYVGNESERASVRNNVVFQNDEGAITDEGTGTVRNHNLRNDPQFVDVAALNFHVLPSSPAVNRGSTIPRVRRDFDGIIRPQCTRFDIGAYEFADCPSPRLI